MGENANEVEGVDMMMPVLFVGHGSPMNAIQDNEYTRALSTLGRELDQPKAVLCISAHWMTRGTWVTIHEKPGMIYDMGGFPKELYEVGYPAPGSPEVAMLTQSIVGSDIIQGDSRRGFDHGNWTVMKWLYPQADVPLFQMSIDYSKPAQYHYDLAKQLVVLRSNGVLIIGSGNITHNLRIFDTEVDAPPIDWAGEFDEITRKAVDNSDHKKLIEYETLGASARLSIPEPSHWLPLIYTLGLQMKGDSINHFFEGMQHGSISMRSIKLG